MVQENEIVTLVLAVGVIVFFAVNYNRIKKFPWRKLFLAAFVAMVMGWVFTVLEGFYWPEAFNLLEHASHMLGSILLAIWCWKSVAARKDTL